MRIAIVGSGIAGLASAHLLGPRHEVVLYEADGRLGGHSNTVEVDDPDIGPVGIDTGFIVHNDRNYPNLMRLFAELGIDTVDSEMSFAVHDPSDGFFYRATSPNTLFADRRRILDPSMWRMLIDIARFYRSGRSILSRAAAGDTGLTALTIGDLLDNGRYGSAFVDRHLIPMGAAVWSADPSRFRDFPAVSLLRFLDNHGLLSVANRPQWKTVVGGSRVYVAAIERRFRGSIRRSTPVRSVLRRPDGVVVTDHRGRTERYDQIVLACHSDQSLALLADPSGDEKRDLGAVGYQTNEAVLHTDVDILPPNRRAWAAWNYQILEGVDRPTVTYDISLLMRLPTRHRYLVTLNDPGSVDPARVIERIDYAHPVFDHEAVAAQARIRASNGTKRTWFCGAWLGYGFHEDGMVSAVEVCRSLGANW